MKALKLFLIIVIALAITGITGCDKSEDDETSIMDPKTRINIASDAVSQMKDILEAVNQKRDDSKKKRNFYPSPDITEVSTTDLQSYDTTPADLGPGTYFYTNTEGDRCELTIGDLTAGQYPVELITYPVNSVAINYYYEKVMVLPTSWDPVNSAGEVDFTARDPYYVQYFDGKKEEITMVETGNGYFGDDSLNLAYYDDFASYPGLTWDTSDSNDYFSRSTFSFTAKNFWGQTKKFGEGVRAYAENKIDGDTISKSVTKEYSSRGFEILWGLFSKKQNESYFTTFTPADGITKQYSVIDVGKGLLWFLDKDEQYLGYATKEFDTDGNMTYNSQYTFYIDGWLGFKHYGVKKISLTGSSTLVTGTIKTWKKLLRKPNNDKFNDLPIDDDAYATLNPADYQLTQSEIDAAFSYACTINVRSEVIGTTRNGTDGTLVTAETNELLVPLADGSGYAKYSATATYNTATGKFNIEIKDTVGAVVISITDAVREADFIKGTAEINGVSYDVALPLVGQGGIYKATGSDTYSEL